MSEQTFNSQDGQVLSWPFPFKPAREVQLDALSKGYDREGFAYFMRQRLGKTLTSFAEYSLLRQQKKVLWMMVVCPNSLKQQWSDQIEEVDPFIPIHIYEASKKKDIDSFFSTNKKTGGVFIINYESMNAFVKDKGYAKLDTLKTYIVADESTKIKDWSTKMTKASVEFASLCVYKRVLTGRPKSNTNLDLWSQLKFINCTARTHNQHKFTFTMVGGFQGKMSVGDLNTEVLQSEMEPHCYIAPDKYIKGFDKVYEPIKRVSLAGTQLRLYKEMQDNLMFELAGGDGINITAPIILTKYLRLQQISSGIAGDEEGNQHNIVEPSDNPRIIRVKEILDDEITGKCIIICRFKLSIKNLYSELTRHGYICDTFVGGMTPAETEQKKARFNNGDTEILIAQSQVLSFGHTLPGPDEKPCNAMIFYENTFSLIDRVQCESRPEKYERSGFISYYDLACSKMDRYMLESLIKKEDASLELMKYSRNFGMMPSGKQQLSEIYARK